MACYNILIFFVVFTFVNSEVVKFESCEKYYQHAKYFKPDDCTIHEVRVNPCPEASHNDPCAIKKLTNFTLSIDFTPQFQSRKLGVFASWISKRRSIAFSPVTQNGCYNTGCPLQPGRRQIYRTDVIRVGGKCSSQNPYTARWVLYGENDGLCCVTFQIKLRPSY